MASAPVLVVIQARLSSTRLPGKALLTLGGRPSVLLCAQRASNTGLPVVVATSDERPDDAIHSAMAEAGFACVRGPLNDVLLRFINAAAHLPDEAILVRLTADNVFPDGAFVQSLIDAYRPGNESILCTSSPQDGLPYGLSAEVFTAGVLRQAHAASRSAFEREHVTPWMRRQSDRIVRMEAPAHWSRLRCTLDSFEDYERLLQVFVGIDDPVHVPWRSLVKRLAAVSPLGDRPRVPFKVTADRRVHGVLALGTVQLGLPYGVANSAGVPTDDEVTELLRDAVDGGITAIDTARAYGLSESRIGQLMSAGLRDRVQMITKLDVLDRWLPDDASPEAVRHAVDASVFASAHALNAKRLDTLLLHRWAYRHAFGGKVWTRLLELRDEGVIGRLGASVSTPDEALAALADEDIAHLQCPVNLLDQRWRAPEFLRVVHARSDVVVHARSVLLQGLLTLPAQAWTRSTATQSDAAATCDALDRAVRELGRKDRVDLCLAYVRSLPWVTSLVVGMQSVLQLHDNLDYVQSASLTTRELQWVDDQLPRLSVSVLDPAQWNVVEG